MDDDERTEWSEFRARLPEPLRELRPEDGPVETADVVELDGRELGTADLLSTLHEQVRLRDLGGPLARSEAAQLGYVPYAWRAVVYRQVRAVIALSDVGLAVQAQPNARAALEHAVMLHAAATAESSGSGLDFLRAVAAEQNKHAVRALKRCAAGTRTRAASTRRLWTRPWSTSRRRPDRRRT